MFEKKIIFYRFKRHNDVRSFIYMSTSFEFNDTIKSIKDTLKRNDSVLVAIVEIKYCFVCCKLYDNDYKTYTYEEREDTINTLINRAKEALKNE